MKNTVPTSVYDLYLHGPQSICRNCGEHDSRHTSQFVPFYGYRAMVCREEARFEAQYSRNEMIERRQRA